MQLDVLLGRLPEGAEQARFLGYPETDVYTLGFLTADTTELRSDVLYMGDVFLLPEAVEQDKIFNCVVFGAEVPPSYADASNTNLVLLAPGVDPFACYNALQDFFMEDQRRTDVIRRMLMAHFSNRGLAYLVEEAAIALGNPIDVIDPTYRHIAHHLGGASERDSPATRRLADDFLGGTLTQEVIDYIRDERIDSELAHTKGPLLRFNHILGHYTLTKAVMVNGICIAHVMLVEYLHPFTQIDIDCFDRFASFVAQEMQKSEIWQPTVGEMGSFFLASLLSDRSPSEAVTKSRLKALNFHPKPVLFVLCLHAKGEGLEQLQAERIAGQLRALLHHSLYTRFHQNLVLLISRDHARDLDAGALRLLGEVGTLNGLSVGISNHFERLVEARKAYDQARSAIRLGEVERGEHVDGAIYPYSSLAYLHLLELANRRTNLMDYCDPSLLALQDYDRRHGTELMDTLWCYLQLSGSTTRCAEALNLHKNTMLYRMGRIKDVLGVNLASGEECFRLQLGFRVLRYLGLFAPRSNWA